MVQGSNYCSRKSSSFPGYGVPPATLEAYRELQNEMRRVRRDARLLTLSGSSIRPSHDLISKDSSAVKCCSSSHRHPDPYDAAPDGGAISFSLSSFRQLKVKDGNPAPLEGSPNSCKLLHPKLKSFSDDGKHGITISLGHLDIARTDR